MQEVTLSAWTKQREPGLMPDGYPGRLQGTRLGQLFTADWKMRLLLAGCCYNVTVGDAANAGDAPAGIANTTLDSDQPEFAMGIPAGYYLIPIRFMCGVKCDQDADAETTEIVFYADTTQSIPAPVIATSTLETPTPLFNVANAKPSVAYAQSAVTADITDPVGSMLLVCEISRLAATTAANVSVASNKALYQPKLPPILKGPCSLIASFGGTGISAGTGFISVDWAEIPAAWVE